MIISCIHMRCSSLQHIHSKRTSTIIWNRYIIKNSFRHTCIHIRQYIINCNLLGRINQLRLRCFDWFFRRFSNHIDTIIEPLKTPYQSSESKDEQEQYGINSKRIVEVARQTLPTCTPHNCNPLLHHRFRLWPP